MLGAVQLQLQECGSSCSVVPARCCCVVVLMLTASLRRDMHPMDAGSSWCWRCPACLVSRPCGHAPPLSGFCAILAAVRLQCSLAPMLCAVSFRWSARSFWQLLSGQASLCMRVFVHPVWLVVLKCGRQNNSGCAASRGVGSWGILEGVLGVTGTALWFGGPVNVPRGYQEGCNTDWHLDVPR